MGPVGFEPTTNQVKQIMARTTGYTSDYPFPNRACTFQCTRLSRSPIRTSCAPSPCIGHYPDYLSTMGTPSPCVPRRLDDPQVPLHTTSARRFPVHPSASMKHHCGGGF